MTDKRAADLKFETPTIQLTKSDDGSILFFEKLPAINVLKKIISISGVNESITPDHAESLVLISITTIIDLARTCWRLSQKPTEEIKFQGSESPGALVYKAIKSAIDIHDKHNVNDRRTLPQTIANLEMFQQLCATGAKFKTSKSSSTQTANAKYDFTLAQMMAHIGTGRATLEEVRAFGRNAVSGQPEEALIDENAQNLRIKFLTPLSSWTDEDVNDANKSARLLTPNAVDALCSAAGINYQILADGFEHSIAALRIHQNLIVPPGKPL